MTVKPFLRWAGGKNWFVKQVERFTPPNINNYFEPFLGGGSIFFHLFELQRLNGDIVLNDYNPLLVNTYQILKDHPNELFGELLKFSNDKDSYYKIRNIVFENNISSAAQFIYLNRTSFNGIYRVNKKGVYNVPYGFKKYSLLFDLDNMIKISSILRNTQIECGDFWDIRQRIQQGDFIFVDPPYTVAHGKNGFIKYNQKLFAWDDQIRLKRFLDEINELGAYYLLTNAAHESILDLFSQHSNRYELERSCVIGSDPEKRKKVKEYIFTNY